jgi:hypothetical protein
MATMRLLNIDAKKWSVEGGQDPPIHRRWHLAFHLEMGALRPPVATLAEKAGSWLGVGLSPGLSPLSIFCRSAPPLHHGSKLKIQAPVRWGQQ